MRHKTISRFASLIFLVPALAMAGLKPGSVVIYTDGDVEKLVEQNQEWSLWEDQRNRRYKRSYLPYFPVLEYRRFKEAPSGYDQFVPDISAVELKPFSSRESVKFSLTRKDLIKGTRSRLWRCSYAGQSSYRLSKQDLVTQDYSCTRYVMDKLHTQKFREKLVVSYSPTLNLVVKQVKTNRRGKETHVAVKRILTPERATAKRIARTVYKLHTSR
ncbi:hypothetical protein AMJAP_3021 [Amphritea japonica ATCC BAA-1530]|uniref:Uncharacterized protein n=2 Tax=Amphritea TaxID=515417 RepID=A0A7R6PEH4_9GAMM|nr:hypothetical protein AMJAP_3021 [Amphritea japonica ATCC BAA-1530]